MWPVCSRHKTHCSQGEYRVYGIQLELWELNRQGSQIAEMDGLKGGHTSMEGVGGGRGV